MDHQQALGKVSSKGKLPKAVEIAILSTSKIPYILQVISIEMATSILSPDTGKIL